MEKRSRLFGKFVWIGVGLALVIFPRPIGAQFSGTIGSGEYSLSTSIQLESAWQYSGRTGGDFENVTDYYTLKAVPTVDFGNLGFRGSFWLRGDEIYDFRRGDPDFKEFRRGWAFTQNFNRELRPGGSNHWRHDTFEKENIKEAYFVYRMAPFTLRTGKQQISWGESDGVQLIDVLNPIDVRREFVLRDFDETKIPLAMITLEADLQGISPMGNLGFADENLEFYAIPDVQGQRFLINNPFDRENGGVWGFPMPPDCPSFPKVTFGCVESGFNFHLPRKELGRNFDNAAYGARYKFSFSGIQTTLNYFHGWQNEPVGRNLGVDLFAVTPGGPVRLCPPSVPHCVPAAAIPAFLTTLPSVPPASGGLSIVSDNQIDFTNRRKFVGFTMSRELTMIQLPPKNVSPVVRVEFKYEFDRWFNTVTPIPNTFCAFAFPPFLCTPTITRPFFDVKRRDQLGYLIGLDYNMFIPPIFERRSLNTSFQFFHIRTLGNLHPQTEVFPGFVIPSNFVNAIPYANWLVPKNQYFASVKLDTRFDDDRLVPDILFVYDFAEKAFFIRQRLDFQYFGVHWRPRLEVDHIEGPFQRSFGLVRDNDQVKFVLAYQF